MKIKNCTDKTLIISPNAGMGGKRLPNIRLDEFSAIIIHDSIAGFYSSTIKQLGAMFMVSTSAHTDEELAAYSEVAADHKTDPFEVSIEGGIEYYKKEAGRFMPERGLWNDKTGKFEGRRNHWEEYAA